jgi:hypothetical protein
MLVVSGCMSGDALEPAPGTEFVAEPRILVIPSGSSATTTITAYDSRTHAPTDVEWAVGRVDPGITVKVDSSFGTVYVNNHLGLPVKSQTRRFIVTLTGDTGGNINISGDAGVITLQVKPGIVSP